MKIKCKFQLSCSVLVRLLAFRSLSSLQVQSFADNEKGKRRGEGTPENHSFKCRKKYIDLLFLHLLFIQGKISNVNASDVLKLFTLYFGVCNGGGRGDLRSNAYLLKTANIICEALSLFPPSLPSLIYSNGYESMQLCLYN